MHEPEECTESIRRKAHWSLLAWLRGGTAPLQIETGRYVGLPQDQRICKLRKNTAVEDKTHFCTTCSALALPCIPLFQTMEATTPGFSDINERDHTSC